MLSLDCSGSIRDHTQHYLCYLKPFYTVAPHTFSLRISNTMPSEGPKDVFLEKTAKAGAKPLEVPQESSRDRQACPRAPAGPSWLVRTSASARVPRAVWHGQRLTSSANVTGSVCDTPDGITQRGKGALCTGTAAENPLTTISVRHTNGQPHICKWQWEAIHTPPAGYHRAIE